MRYASLIILMSALLWAQQSPSWGRAYVDSAASVVPQYIVSPVVDQSTRVPYVAYLTIRGLEPNTTYRYVVRMDDNTSPPTSLNVNAGAGNPIYYDPNANTFTRVTSVSLTAPGGYGTLNTDASGSIGLTFILEPTRNARFDVSKTVYPKVFLREDVSTSPDSAVVISDRTPVKPIAFGSNCPSQDTCGSFFYDSVTPGLVNSKFVFLYDEYLLGPNPPYKRPIAGAIIEPTGISYPTSYLLTYHQQVAGQTGRWGTIIPNTLPNGIRSIIYHERGHLAYPSYDLADVGIYDRDGIWPSGYNTANPNNGPAPVGLLMSLTQPLRPVSGIRPPDAFERGAFIWRNLFTNPLCANCDGFFPIHNDHLLSSSFSFYGCQSPGGPGPNTYSENCAYGINSGPLPAAPADSTLPPVTWPIVGGPGWSGQFGDSIVVYVQAIYNPMSGTFFVPTFDGNLNSCSSCPVIDCDELFTDAYTWTFKLHPVAFSNEAGNLVLNYNYFDQRGGADPVSSPFYAANVPGPFSAPTTPLGLIETSGADLSALNVNATPQLFIRAILPYEVRIYSIFPFQYGTANYGYLEWELVNASNGNIITSGNSNFPGSFNSCTAYPAECTYQTTVPVSNLSTGTYRIRGRIIPPTCPSGGYADPILTDSITFTVTVGTALSSQKPARVLIQTTPSAWIVEGLSGEAVLYDSQGRRLWTGQAENHRLSIPRSSLRPGLYLLVTESPAGPITYRLLHIE